MSNINESTITFGGSRAAYNTLMKDMYGKKWDDAIHSAGEVAGIIAKKKARMGGRKTIMAVTTAWTQSAGIATFEGGAMPNPRVGQWANPELISRGLYSRLRWTLESRLAARAGDQAMWSKPKVEDVKQAQETMKVNFDRQLINGYADVLGVVASHTTSGGVSVITLQPRDSRTSSGAASWYRGNFHFRVGMELGLIDSANGALGDPSADITVQSRVVAVTAKGGTTSAPTITLDQNASGASYFNNTPAAGDYLVPFGNRRASVDADAGDAISDFSSINGMLNLASDATNYSVSMGLSKTTYPNMAGLYLHNNGVPQAFSEHQIMLLNDRVADEGTGQSFTRLLTSKATRRSIVLEHDGDRRYPAVLGTSGFGSKLGASLGDTSIPYKSLWQLPTHMIWGIDDATFGWASLQDMAPVDNVPERWVTDYASHEQLWSKHGNLFCTRAYANGLLDDVETRVYDLPV